MRSNPTPAIAPDSTTLRTARRLHWVLALLIAATIATSAPADTPQKDDAPADARNNSQADDRSVDDAQPGPIGATIVRDPTLIEQAARDRDADARASSAVDPSSPTAAPTSTDTRRSTAQPTVRTIGLRLEQPVESVMLDQVAADRAFRWFSDVTGVAVVINWRQMEQDGLDRQTPINLTLHSIPARNLLALMMQQLSADEPFIYEVTPWYVRVMTKRQANRFRVVQVYDVTDLLHVVPDFDDAPELRLEQAQSVGGRNGGGGNVFGGGGSVFGPDNGATSPQGGAETQRGQALVDLIRDTIEPQVWDTLGGEATIRYFNGRLIVNAPMYVHRQIGIPTVAATTQRRLGSRASAASSAPQSRYDMVSPPPRPTPTAGGSNVSTVRQTTDVSTTSTVAD